MRGRSERGSIRWPQPHWADAITLTGLALTVNEAVFRHGPERPGFQFMFLAMMGVSPMIRADERRVARRDERRDEQRRSGRGGRR